MEPINKGDAITLDDGKEYFVVDIVYDEGSKYIYLITDEEDNKVLLGEEIIEDGEVYIETLDDVPKIREIMAKIVENEQ